MAKMGPAAKATALAWHRRWYRHVRELPDGQSWAAVSQGLFNAQIIRGRFDDALTILDHW